MTCVISGHIVVESNPNQPYIPSLIDRGDDFPEMTLEVPRRVRRKRGVVDWRAVRESFELRDDFAGGLQPKRRLHRPRSLWSIPLLSGCEPTAAVRHTDHLRSDRRCARDHKGGQGWGAGPSLSTFRVIDRLIQDKVVNPRISYLMPMRLQ